MIPPYFLIFCLVAVTVSHCTASKSAYVDAWNKYVEDAESQYDIQADCVPFRREAAPSSVYRGVVLLLHGFTACPQQYYDMASILTTEGYDVIVPLLPGHGAEPTAVDGKTQDNIDYLPNKPQEYQDFGDRMNGIIAIAPGEHAVVGLSLGGTVAAYVGMGSYDSNSSKPIYDRQLVTVPLLELPQKILQGVLGLMSKIPKVRDIRIGWGPGCEEERLVGRAGICQFSIAQCEAAIEFGQLTFDYASTPLEGLQTQVLYDWKDGAVSVDKIQDLYERYGTPVSGKSVCALPEDKVHSFLSRYDNPGLNMYWMEELVCRMTSFIIQKDVDEGSDMTRGGFMAVNAHKDKDPRHRGWPRCDMSCEKDSCPFDDQMVVTCPFTKPLEREGYDSFSDETYEKISSTQNRAQEEVRVVKWDCLAECVESNCSFHERDTAVGDMVRCGVKCATEQCGYSAMSQV